MTETRSWQEMYAEIARRLERTSGADVATWKSRIEANGSADEASLRAWLTEQGVTGYGQQLLVMERFGYPAWALAQPDALVEAQYADRPALRPILDALLLAAGAIGPVTIQARKGYVALLTQRRTFASIEPTTRSRVDLGLRLPDVAPAGRALAATSLGQSAMTHRIPLASADDIDDEVGSWLRRAYDANR